MNETPVLNVVVLGASPATRPFRDVLQNVGIQSTDGTTVQVKTRVWSSGAATEDAGVTTDPAIVEAPEVQVVIACLPEPAEQVAMIRRALAAGKHVLAVPPIAEKRTDAADLIERAQAAGIVTGVTETPDEVIPFLEGILRNEPRVPDWRSWVGVSVDPADEILAAIAKLPPNDKAGRARLLRALDLLREGRGR